VFTSLTGGSWLLADGEPAAELPPVGTMLMTLCGMAPIVRVRTAEPTVTARNEATEGTAAGTGIAARLFRAAGCRVLGVDPDPRMAELARQGGTEVEVAKFEDWESAGRTFDAVIAAQAWHWVDPVAGVAKAAAVLRPGGRLAAFWNAFEPPKDLREAFAEIFRRVLPDSAVRGFWDRPAVEAYRAGCARVADAIRRAGAFGEPEEWLSCWERPYTRDEWLDLVPTTGGFTQRPEAVQAELLDSLGAVVDAAGGTFTMSYTTIAATAARLASQQAGTCPERSRQA